jgi:hypothetical protein
MAHCIAFGTFETFETFGAFRTHSLFVLHHCSRARNFEEHLATHNGFIVRVQTLHLFKQHFRLFLECLELGHAPALQNVVLALEEFM